MGRPQGWAATRAGRPAMRSPGRPPMARREHRQRFWVAIAGGMPSEDAGIEAGVSPAVGTRWFRDSGGIRPVSLAPLSGRYLSFAEREEIAILRARGCGVREIARRTGRSPSTVSRELSRNAATRGGRLEYRATTAQWHADRRARRPKIAKLAANQVLREYVQDRLAGTITRPDGAAVAGPDVRWIGRRHGRRADRRWARSWSLAFAIFYTKVHDRVLAPLFAAGQPQSPPQLRAALNVIEHHIDERLAAARLPAAA
jgi:hypothetical protein